MVALLAAKQHFYSTSAERGPARHNLDLHKHISHGKSTYGLRFDEALCREGMANHVCMWLSHWHVLFAIQLDVFILKQTPVSVVFLAVPGLMSRQKSAQTWLIKIHILRQVYFGWKHFEGAVLNRNFRENIPVTVWLRQTTQQELENSPLSTKETCQTIWDAHAFCKPQPDCADPDTFSSLFSERTGCAC